MDSTFTVYAVSTHFHTVQATYSRVLVECQTARKQHYQWRARSFAIVDTRTPENGKTFSKQQQDACVACGSQSMLCATHTHCSATTTSFNGNFKAHRHVMLLYAMQAHSRLHALMLFVLESISLSDRALGRPYPLPLA